MNKRLKELVVKADRRWIRTPPSGEVRGLYDKIFADIIVQECITVLKNSVAGYDDRALFHPIELMDRTEVILKEHFGID